MKGNNMNLLQNFKYACKEATENKTVEGISCLALVWGVGLSGGFGAAESALVSGESSAQGMGTRLTFGLKTILTAAVLAGAVCKGLAFTRNCILGESKLLALPKIKYYRHEDRLSPHA